MQTRAEAFNAWKAVDPSRKVTSLLNVERISSWIDQSLCSNTRGPYLVSKYLKSLEKLLDSFTETEVKETDRQRVLNHIYLVQRLLKIGSDNERHNGQVFFINTTVV